LVFQKTRTPKNKRVSGVQPRLSIKLTANSKSEIFKEAWILARKEAFLKGGSCRDHIGKGLRTAWKNFRNSDLVEFKMAA